MRVLYRISYYTVLEPESVSFVSNFWRLTPLDGFVIKMRMANRALIKQYRQLPSPVLAAAYIKTARAELSRIQRNAHRLARIVSAGSPRVARTTPSQASQAAPQAAPQAGAQAGAPLTYRSIRSKVFSEITVLLTVKEACEAARPLIDQMDVKGKTPMASFKAKLYMAVKHGELQRIKGKLRMSPEAQSTQTVMLLIGKLVQEHPASIPSFLGKGIPRIVGIPEITDLRLQEARDLLPRKEEVDAEKFNGRLWEIGKALIETGDIIKWIVKEQIQNVGGMLAADMSRLDKTKQMFLMSRLYCYLVKRQEAAANLVNRQEAAAS
jgi:hypothetical protein